MAERDDDLRFLVESAQRAIAQQRNQHARLLASTSQRRGRGLIAHVEETLRAIHSHLTVSEGRFAGAATDVERDSVLSTLRLLNGFLGQTQQANTWVEAAAGQKLGEGALRLVDEAAGALVGTDGDVVTVPSDAYRFATIWAPFSRILNQLGVTSSLNAFPIVVFFPSQETRALLLQPLLIHELGHSTVARYSLVDRVVAHRVGKRKFDRAFSSAATALSRATSTSRPASKIIVEKYLRRWLTEYLCDAVAVSFCGPPYAYAFAAVVSAQSATELQESHPPTALRIRLLLEHLTTLGWAPLIRSRTPNVEAWLRYLASSTPTPIAPHHQFLLNVTDEFIRPIRDEVLAILAGRSFQPAAYEAQSDDLDAFLQRRILPAQLSDGSAADRRSIVLAGWFHVLSGPRTEGSEGDAAWSLPAGLANWEFGSFLDKAVEMSSVLEAWREK